MYVVNGDTAVGVPLISPVDESMERPVGRAGWISHDVTTPPFAVGVSAVIAVPTVSTNVLVL